MDLFAAWLLFTLGGAIVETVEVSPPLGAAASLAADRQAEPRVVEFSGVLPQDFPASFPIEPAWSLLDFGAARAGRRYVTLRVSGDLAAARAHLEGLLAAAGWWALAGDPARWRGADGEVRLAFKTARGATQMRVEY